MNKGAKYFKCDFQVHTPRDENFAGSEYISEEARKDYSEKFIKNCREKKLGAVAITDHHDMWFFNYIKAASLNENDEFGIPIDEEDRIIVFPGMELTLEVPCQSLLIFDSDLEMSDELIIKIYTALEITGHSPKSDSKTGPTNQLPFKSNNKIYEALDKIPGLKGRYIIFPNVKDNGSNTIFRTGLYNEYAKGIFVGGYLDRGQYDSHKSRVGWNNIIDGKTEAYGNRSIGLFQTSDNRTDTFEHLGLSVSWVKWSAPTAEGLRQACLAKKSRILQDEPKLPITRIKDVKIKGSSFLKNLDIDFNPQFNVCIGGRGTGKSSLLQYISWALGKDSNPDKKNELENFVKNTLSDEGSVEITILKNSIPHIVHRTLNSYKIKIGNDDWQNTNSDNVVSIIKSDSFSQKELSSHEKDKTIQLTRIIENAVSDNVESIKRQLSENGNKIKETSASYEAFLSNQKSSDNLKTQIESVKGQIKALNEQLLEVPAADQNIIKNNSLVAEEKESIKKSVVQLNGLTTQISNILDKGNFNLLQIDSSSTKNVTEIADFVKEHNSSVEIIKSSLEAILQVTSPNLELKKSILEGLHVQHDKEYLDAKGRQAKFEQTIKELEELRNRLTILNGDRNRILETLESEKGLKKKLQSLFYQRNQLNINLWEIINGSVLETAGRSENTLEIELSPLDNIQSNIDSFLSKVTGSKGQPQRTQVFFETLKKGNFTYKELLKFYFSIYKAKAENQKIETVISDYGLMNSSLLETDFERVTDSLNTSLIIDMALELPSYALKLLFCKDASNKIRFEDASYGQQAGSILTILLNQEFGPLIIDQPEDDLDNKVIHQITENIVAAKHKRQLIFSSHNANVAVNGDAELILTFDHNSDKSSGEIVASGSIDKDEIKHHVKEVMEGGNKAFELRKTKYGF
jgi:chromosome segregation protein